MTSGDPGVEGIVLRRASVNGNGYVVLLDGDEPLRVRSEAGRCPVLWERGQTVPNTIAAAISLARGICRPSTATEIRLVEQRQIG